MLLDSEPSGRVQKIGEYKEQVARQTLAFKVERTKDAKRFMHFGLIE
jgi:hypothetical protein